MKISKKKEKYPSLNNYPLIQELNKNIIKKEKYKNEDENEDEKFYFIRDKSPAPIYFEQSSIENFHLNDKEYQKILKKVQI